LYSSVSGSVHIPTGEHGTHTKEGTTKGEREMTEVACSGQHGK